MQRVNFTSQSVHTVNVERLVSRLREADFKNALTCLSTARLTLAYSPAFIHREHRAVRRLITVVYSLELHFECELARLRATQTTNSIAIVNGIVLYAKCADRQTFSNEMCSSSAIDFA